MSRTAYARRMIPVLRQELVRVRTERNEIAHRLEVCESGRDPLHSPRMVPVLRSRIAELFKADRALEDRIEQLDPEGPYAWLDQ
jgi:hypothetical protein